MLVDFSTAGQRRLPASRDPYAFADRWLPGGRREGRELSCAIPSASTASPDRSASTSRRGNGRTSPPDGGGDPISLAAFLFDLSQRGRCLRVADMLGVDPERRS